MLNANAYLEIPQSSIFLPQKAISAMDDGVTKFKLTLKMASAPQTAEVVPVEKWRAILWRLRLVGEYPNEKIGYGNLSVRLPLLKNGFLITGTQTGHRPHLRREHYTRVVSCDPTRNLVKAEGAIGPSSESLTHYAIYEAQPQVSAVFHVHHKLIWERLLDSGADSIDESIAYGTREMAEAAKLAIKGKDSGIIVMKGHPEGIIAYGPTPEVAGKLLLKLYRELGPQEVL